MKRNLFIAALLLKFVLLAHATDVFNAGTLKGYCQKLNDFSTPAGSAKLTGPNVTNQVADDLFDAGGCAGYMNGWLQGVAGMAILDSEGKIRVVQFANGITAGQMSRVFVTYMNKHPEIENQSAEEALGRAMTDTGLVQTVPPPVHISTN